MFAWKQPSSWKREGHLLVILACDGKINSRSSSGCRASVGMTRSIAHRNHVTSVSDLGIAVGWMSSELGKDCLGLDQCQTRLYTAIERHIVLVMAALAICAITAAQLKDRTDIQAPAPLAPDQTPPPDPGIIPLTVPEIN